MHPQIKSNLWATPLHIHIYMHPQALVKVRPLLSPPGVPILEHHCPDSEPGLGDCTPEMRHSAAAAGCVPPLDRGSTKARRGTARGYSTGRYRDAGKCWW